MEKVYIPAMALTTLLIYKICIRLSVFLLLFVIAFPFKQYAVFVFLPLMLLREKNLFNVAFRLFIVFFFRYLSNLPIRSDSDINSNKAEFAQAMYQSLVKNKLPLLNSTVSVLVVLFGVLCIYCYLKKVDTTEDENEYVLFVALTAMVVVFSSFMGNPYWYVHLAPYLSIAVVYWWKSSNKVILFEIIGMSSLVLSHYAIFYWCYEITNMKNMLLFRLSGNPEMNNDSPVLRYIANSFMGQHTGELTAVFLLCMAVIVYLCRPNQKTIEVEDCSIRLISILRLSVNCILCSIPIFLYFFEMLRGWK